MKNNEKKKKKSGFQGVKRTLRGICMYIFHDNDILHRACLLQAHKSKIIISEINNRYLDDDVKEEVIFYKKKKKHTRLYPREYVIYFTYTLQLQLFFHQISSCTIEFTACDFFTLNTHLITSVSHNLYIIIIITK